MIEYRNSTPTQQKILQLYFSSGTQMKEEAENSYIPSKYSKSFNCYSRNEIKHVVPILKSIAKSCTIGFKYPVYKVLKAIAKIFLLNEIQSIFFAYMIRETSWDIKDKLITHNSQHVRDVVCYSNDQPQYKNLILYLMLVTYSLKFYLNQNNEDLLEEAQKICPNFKIIFENWAKKHSQLTKRINPKTLNKVYQDLYIKIRHEEPDNGTLVDAILQISPAYNPQKSEKDKRMIGAKQDKKEVMKEEYFGREPYKLVKTEGDSHIFDNIPIFSSSRINQMTGAGMPIHEISNSFQIFGQQKNSVLSLHIGGSAFCSSVVGIPNHGFQLKDEEDDCEDLNIGLQDGESEENIILKDATPDNPLASTISFGRKQSITERYLNFKMDLNNQSKEK